MANLKTLIKQLLSEWVLFLFKMERRLQNKVTAAVTSSFLILARHPAETGQQWHPDRQIGNGWKLHRAADINSQYQ